MNAGIIALGAVQSMLQISLDQRFYEIIRHFPPDQQERLIEERKAAKEKARVEAIEERRHREMCAAIRSTKPDHLSIDVNLTSDPEN